MKTLFATSLMAVALAAACSSSPKPTTEPAATEPTATEPAATEPAATEPAATEPAAGDLGEGVAWADKSHEQKVAFMKQKVVPAVAAIWTESPEPDEEVKCTTCHGKGALEGKFAMPSDSLPQLDPSNQFAAHHDEGEWLQFMGEKLVPTMTSTLGVTAYDPATQKGFGCFACHTMAGAN